MRKKKAIRLDRQVWHIVSRCALCETDEPDPLPHLRDQLQSVRIEPSARGGVVAVASNGHIICAGWDREGECPEGGATVQAFRDSRTRRLSKPKALEFIDSGRGYVEWRKVMTHPIDEPNPVASKTEVAMVDPALYHLALKSNQIHVVQVYDSEKGVHLFSKCGRFHWVLMPLRWDDGAVGVVRLKTKEV